MSSVARVTVTLSFRVFSGLSRLAGSERDGRTSCRGELRVVFLARYGIAPGPCGGGTGFPRARVSGGSWLFRRLDIGLGPGGPTYIPNPCAPTTQLVHDRLLYDWAINALHNPLGNSTTNLILYRQLVHVILPNSEVRLNPHEHLWLNMIVLRISVVATELGIMSSAPGGSRGWMDGL